MLLCQIKQHIFITLNTIYSHLQVQQRQQQQRVLQRKRQQQHKAKGVKYIKIKQTAQHQRDPTLKREGFWIRISSK